MPEDKPTRLTAEEIDQALADLPGWSGDEHALQRTVEFSPDRVDPLVDEVHRIEKELNHHAQMESKPTDGDSAVITFKIWTHTVGGVTGRDVELASRIQKAVTQG
jgi:4a-hydroxytetrahydrobiopterin dehydratase